MRELGAPDPTATGIAAAERREVEVRRGIVRTDLLETTPARGTGDRPEAAVANGRGRIAGCQADGSCRSPRPWGVAKPEVTIGVGSEASRWGRRRRRQIGANSRTGRLRSGNAAPRASCRAPGACLHLVCQWPHILPRCPTTLLMHISAPIDGLKRSFTAPRGTLRSDPHRTCRRIHRASSACDKGSGPCARIGPGWRRRLRYNHLVTRLPRRVVGRLHRSPGIRFLSCNATRSSSPSRHSSTASTSKRRPGDWVRLPRRGFTRPPFGADADTSACLPIPGCRLQYDGSRSDRSSRRDPAEVRYDPSGPGGCYAGRFASPGHGRRVDGARRPATAGPRDAGSLERTVISSRSNLGSQAVKNDRGVRRRGPGSRADRAVEP